MNKYKAIIIEAGKKKEKEVIVAAPSRDVASVTVRKKYPDCRVVYIEVNDVVTIVTKKRKG